MSSLPFINRECHRGLESPSTYNDTISNVSMTLAPSPVADKGRISRIKKEAPKGKGWWGMWARTVRFSEPALCWALNTLYLLSFTFQTGALTPTLLLCSWRCHDNVISMPKHSTLYSSIPHCSSTIQRRQKKKKKSRLLSIY